MADLINDNAAIDRLRMYHEGKPLTPELAEIKEGRQTQEAASKVRTMPHPSLHDPMRELTNTERGILRELKLHPGWAVLQRLKEKSLQMHVSNAISKSQIDPLGEADQVVKAWAYVTMIRRVYHELEVMIEVELKAQDETL